MIYKKNEVGNMPKYAVLCRIEALGVKTSEGGINLAKHGILTHRKAFKNNDKNPVRLPWQDLMPKQRMAEIGHLWAEWYLIYTLFTPFDLGRNTPLKERSKDMIKILFVCWGRRFQ